MNHSLTLIPPPHVRFNFSTIIILLALFPIVIFAQMTHSVIFENISKNYIYDDAKDNNEYAKILYEELVNTDIVGAPSLPVKFIKLIVPAQQDLDKVTFTYKISDKKTLTSKIYPAQPDIPTLIGVKEPDFANPDPKIYESEKPWPEKVVEFVHSGYLDNNNHIITLKVVPFQYYPKLDQLEELDDIKIDLTLTGNTHKIVLPKIRTFKTQEIWDNALNFIVDNKSDIPRYQHKPQLSEKFESITESIKKPTPVQFYEYTVITTNALKYYFNTLINYKSTKGLNAGIVTVETIYDNYSGDTWSGIYDNQGKIRSYLRDLYEVGGTWVLIGGDHYTVPARYGCGELNNQYNTWDYWDGTDTLEDGNRIPADLYFADRNGDWNIDGDVYTGESFEDDPDYYPELFVGRLLCTGGSEITNWTQKLIKYEQNPGLGNPYYLLKSYMIQSDQMQGQANSVANHLSTFSNTVKGEEPGANVEFPDKPTAHEVLVEMNERYGLYGWFGHGAPNAVTTKSKFLNEQPRWCLNSEDNVETAEVTENQDGLDNLTNIDYLAIVYSIGCENTPFDNHNTDPNNYNMGESFTVNNLTGGPAFLGNTRFGLVYSSYHLFEEFADLIIAGNRHLGVAELISKYNYGNHYLSYSHNLVGCPETEIYTNISQIEKKSNHQKNINDNTNSEIPDEYKIIGNFPNPFNPSTKIKYGLPYTSNVELAIYDILGNEVRSFKLLG